MHDIVLFVSGVLYLSLYFNFLLFGRSLGVTIWELFELGGQPYGHYSDRQVLTYAIKEQQLKLPKPKLPLSLSDRW